MATADPATSAAAPAAARPVFDSGALDAAVIASILDASRRAPSGVNTQPWTLCVLQGGALERLVDTVCRQLPGLCSDAGHEAEFWRQYRLLPGRAPWPGPSWEQAGDTFAARADAAFGAGAIRGEADLHDYFALYRAPVALVCTIDRALGLGSVLDYGMFVQNVVHSAAARGVQAHLLAGWKGFSGAVLAQVAAQEAGLLMAVLALGHARSMPAPVPIAAPAVSARAQTFVHWHD